MPKPSRTITTLQDIKQDEENELIVNSSQYRDIVNTISKLREELELKCEENDVNKIEIEYLKNEITNLVKIADNFKKQIKDKQDKELAIHKSLEEMRINKINIEEQMKKIKPNKYSRKSEEELREMAKNRFEEFRKTYKDLLDG